MSKWRQRDNSAPSNRGLVIRTCRGSLLHRIMTRPLRTSTNLLKVGASKYPWRPLDSEDVGDAKVYGLTLLGLAHYYTGFSLDVRS